MQVRQNSNRRNLDAVISVRQR